MVSGDILVDAIIKEQFRVFLESHEFWFENSNEELERAIKYMGVKSVDDLEYNAAFRAFLKIIERTARNN